MKPRVGFLGTGWIGRHRMAAIVATGLVEAAAVADPSPEGVAEALAISPQAQVVGSLDEMLALRLDGVVIATPSALHAAQAVQALEAGVAVFCQKPLGRSGAEVSAVIAAARKADRLLGIDLSYRETAAMQAIRPLVQDGELGPGVRDRSDVPQRLRPRQAVVLRARAVGRRVPDRPGRPPRRSGAVDDRLPRGRGGERDVVPPRRAAARRRSPRRGLRHCRVPAGGGHCRAAGVFVETCMPGADR